MFANPVQPPPARVLQTRMTSLLYSCPLSCRFVPPYSASVAYVAPVAIQRFRSVCRLLFDLFVVYEQPFGLT